MNESTVVIFTFLAVVLLYLALIGIAIASYIMSSYSYYTIAKRRNIKYPWLAWIPVVNSWTVGCIANNYDLKNGYDRKWHKVLITLASVFYVGIFVTYAFMIAIMIATAFKYGSLNDAQLDFLWILLFAYLVFIVCMIVGMGWQFCYTICIYKIFESTVPKKAIKYTLLYAMVPLAGPICLLKCKDKGYPESQMFDGNLE